jgi:hypothetical protein
LDFCEEIKVHPEYQIPGPVTGYRTFEPGKKTIESSIAKDLKQKLNMAFSESDSEDDRIERVRLEVEKKKAEDEKAAEA